MESRPGCGEEQTAAPEGRAKQPSRTEKDGGESPGGDGTRDNPESGKPPRPRVPGGTPKKTNCWKTVRFREPSEEEPVPERAGSEPSLFPEYAPEEWTSVSFEKLFQNEDWQWLTGRTQPAWVSPAPTSDEGVQSAGSVAPSGGSPVNLESLALLRPRPVPSCRARRRATAGQEGAGAGRPRRPSAHLGPAGLGEDAGRPGGPHGGGEGPRAALHYRGRRREPGKDSPAKSRTSTTSQVFREGKKHPADDLSVAWERIGGVPTHVYENGCFAALSKLHSRHEASLWRFGAALVSRLCACRRWRSAFCPCAGARSRYC